MFTRVRSTLILLAATAGLSGCVGMDPYGYGTGVSIGYGNGYGYGSPYGYGNYGYGSPYGYGAGYGYGDPYYGWYDDFYYPGAGYYVYNRSGSRYRWSDAQRRYWEQRRGNRRGGENWSGYRTPQRAIQDWADRANGVTTNGGTSTQAVRQYRQVGNRSRGMTVRGDRRAVSDDGASRQQVRQERRETRSEARQERSESRGGSWQRAGGGIKVRGDRKAD